MKYPGCYATKHLIAHGFRCLLGVLFVPLLWGQINVLMWHNDQARTGQFLQETLLSPSNVSSSNFGLLPISPLATDGAVDAQPLYVMGLGINVGTHNTLFAVTENDSLYAFDADTGAQLWMQSFLTNGETAVPAGDVGCTQVSPYLGITSTPAIDLSFGAHGTIFFVTMSVKGSNYYQRLHAADITTGAEESGWPITIQATYPSTGPQSSGGVVTFVPKQYKERAALLVSDGIVYTSFASHCDGDPYSGWVIGYNEATQAQVLVNLTPNGEKGAIWQSGAGPAADAGGNLYFLMANGYFDGTLTDGGFPVDGDYGNAFMNLSTITGLTVQDYFTSDNSPTETESQNDADLGSGGPLLLPTLNDAMGNPYALAVGAGKDGNAFIVDRNNMGKYNMSSNAVYQQFSLGGSVYSSPAWFNNTLYYGPSGAQLKAYAYSGGSFGSAASATSHSFGFPGTTPSISANGSSNGIVWAVDSSNSVLYAYDATNLATELYDSTQAGSRDSFGSAVQFPTPTVANGKVYVGTSTGVAVFGLLNCTYGTMPHFTTATTGYISVTATSGCSWSALSEASTLSLTGATSGTGSGTVPFSVAANPGVNMIDTLIAAGVADLFIDYGATTTSGLGFFTLSPCRVADTRGNGFEGQFGTPSLAQATTRNIPVPNSFCNAPNTAQAYSMNMTAVVPGGGALGYLTSFPAGQSLPAVATLNAPNGGVVGNAAIVPAGVDQAISVYASAPTNLVVDINGYFGPPSGAGALAFYPVTPCRVADTRGNGFTGAFGPPSLVGGATRNFPVQESSCGIPAAAQAYSVRMTVVPPGPLGYLSTWPAGVAQPAVATLNAPNGGVVGNEAIVPAGTASGGPISVYVSANTDLVMDINGYFAPPGNTGALFFYPVAPCRIADTRGNGFTGAVGPPALVGGATREFPIQSSCGIPTTAQAYSLNMTVIVPSGENFGYLTAFPAGDALPVAATVNASTGVVGSAAIIPGGTEGEISVYAAHNANLVIDVNGYFAP